MHGEVVSENPNVDCREDHYDKLQHSLGRHASCLHQFASRARKVRRLIIHLLHVLKPVAGRAVGQLLQLFRQAVAPVMHIVVVRSTLRMGGMI